MRYRCMHCDRVFELAEGERARCPTCMRVHGVSAVQDAAVPFTKTASSRATARMVAAAVALAAVAAGALYWRRTAAHDGTAQGVAVAPDALSAELKRLGISSEGLAHALEANDDVERWASGIAGKAAAGLPRAQALVADVRKHAQAEAFVPWSMAEARSDGSAGPLSPADTLALVHRDRGRKQLYPFEVAALVVAALRSLDENAALVEVYAFPDEPKPLDASGRLGYYAVGLRDDAGALKHVLDPYAGRSSEAKQAPRQSDLRVLSDREAIGGALALAAAHALGKDPVKALKDADGAVALSPSSPTTRSARAIALLGNAGSEEAARELQAASQLRTDGPRRHNLAIVLLAAGDIEAAERELEAALKASPEFASAHVTKAGLLLAKGEGDAARKELSEAERIDAQLAALPLVWAQYYQSIGDSAQALVQAERGVERQPEDPQPRIMLAQLYRAAGQVEPMREQARRVVALVPPEQRERVRDLLLRMLGADAFGDAAPAAGTPLGGPTGTLGGGPQLQLGGGAKGPSLFGESKSDGRADAPASGTLRDPNAAPRLQLKP